MTKLVTVVDYGLGNIFSVARAVEHFGAEVRLTSQPDELDEASLLILPGVGAFENGMKGLRERGLVEPLRKYAASGRPLMGICLGMQLLVSSSLEFGVHEGLGIIPGQVQPIARENAGGASIKVPHIGWSPLVRPSSRSSWDGTILTGLAEGSDAYFVHSFAVVPDKEEHRLADTYYGGQRISAAIQEGNVFGCQFHPEKSGFQGLGIVKNFLQCVDTPDYSHGKYGA